MCRDSSRMELKQPKHLHSSAAAFNCLLLLGKVRGLREAQWLTPNWGKAGRDDARKGQVKPGERSDGKVMELRRSGKGVHCALKCKVLACGDDHVGAEGLVLDVPRGVSRAEEHGG